MRFDHRLTPQIVNATASISKTVLGASVAVSPSVVGNNGEETRKPYPIAELLSLLAAFTFAQRTTQGLQRCLRAWAAFVAQATIGEGEGSAGESSPGASGNQSFIYVFLFHVDSQDFGSNA